MTVLMVGSNPSIKNVDPSIPFVGTRSGTILKRWMEELGDHDYVLVNVLDSVTVNNRTLTRNQIKEAVKTFGEKIGTMKYDRIVALGNTASEALKLLKLNHFKLPHPSPKNRVLNDKAVVSATLLSCKEFCERR